MKEKRDSRDPNVIKLVIELILLKEEDKGTWKDIAEIIEERGVRNKKGNAYSPKTLKDYYSKYRDSIRKSEEFKAAYNARYAQKQYEGEGEQYEEKQDRDKELKSKKAFPQENQ